MTRRIEDDGWDGVMVFDSQNLLMDPYEALTLSNTSTQVLDLGIGVSKTATRHPAVTAAALISLHQASSSRAVISIGRGNSALLNIGAGPARMGVHSPRFSRINASTPKRARSAAVSPIGPEPMIPTGMDRYMGHSRGQAARVDRQF